MPKVLSAHVEAYRLLVAYCHAYLKIFVKPCFKLRRRSRLNRRSIFVAMLASLRQTLELRLAAVRDHLRLIHALREQSFYWLHSGNPYSLSS